MNKLNFNDFLKKINFILGDKTTINDLTFNKLDLYHFKEFVNLDDEDFVERMYKILLRRVYDENGKQAKLNELKSGKSRQQIIKDMKNSEEGQNYIGIYELLGIDYNFLFLSEEFLYKLEYSEIEFYKLIDFYNFRFSRLPNNIIDVLNYSGKEFVFLLYKIILKRDPDFEGFKSHLQGSYFLEDKFKKIKEFLSSDEAKQKKSYFYNLNGKNILDINLDSIFEIDEKLFIKVKRKEFVFNFLNNESLFQSILLISSICEFPLKCFKIIVENVLFNNKTIIETIYEKEIVSLIKQGYILIDYFNKVVKNYNFSLVDDIIRNNSFYLSFINSISKEYIFKYNLKNNLILNLDNEIEKIVRFLRKFALKDDLKILYRNDKFLEENINILSDILKEHEEFILNFSNPTKNQNNLKGVKKGRNKRKRI